MAVLRFLYRAEFRKGLADLREIKQGIVSESAVPSGCVQNDAFSGAAEGVNRLAVSGHGQHADESRGASSCGGAGEFAQHTRVVGFVIRVAVCRVRLAGRIAGGMNAGRSAERVNLQARVVG